VSGSVRQQDGVTVRIIAEAAPGPGATPAVPTLEDAYLSSIDRSSAVPAETRV